MAGMKYTDRRSVKHALPDGLHSENELYVFKFRFTKYHYDIGEDAFVPVQFDFYKTYADIHDTYTQGVSEGIEYDNLVDQYGKCSIVLPEKSVIKLLIHEILNPFYVFQLFSVIFWFLSNYEIFAACILFTSIISITAELIDIKRNINKLKEMVSYQCQLVVKRLDSENNVVDRKIWSNDLLPGDIIVVPENVKMPCDAILLTGASIINESMLTGESIPVIKTALPHDPHQNYDPEECKNNTLFSGTEVIQNKKVGGQEATALVIRTSFDTLKGSLIKSILYPKPNRFSFYADSMKFIGVLAIVSVIGFTTTIPVSLE